MSAHAERADERVIARHTSDAGLNWLDRLRAEAAARVESLPLPTTHDEEWRFTDLAPLLKFSFAPAAAAPPLTLADIGHFIIPEAGARLVFVDGHYAAHLSTPTTNGVIVTAFADALLAHEAPLRTHLAQICDVQHDLFAAQNTAAMQNGALAVIPKDHAHSAPLHLLFIATRRDVPTALYPRCLLIAEAGSECCVIEDYVGLGNGVYFSNAVTEVALAENARMQHVTLQREAGSAFHIAASAVTQTRDSVYHAINVTLGARLSRHTMRVTQHDTGTQTRLDGLTLIAERQLADTHSVMDHAHPHGRSAQLHKCVVDGAAHAVFNGKIFVRAGAQLTDAVQSSRNLLLSDKARVDTKPQLEIFADDVKCAHGATVGQLDEEEVFYLKSRGLDDGAARGLLTYAYAAEVIDKIPVASVKKRLRATAGRHANTVTHTQVPS